MADIRGLLIDGLNIEGAIKIIEDEDVLEAMLKTYCEDGADKLEAISNALEAKKTDEYAVYVHALKSSSKAIGAFELSERFRLLELAGKGGDEAYIAENNDGVIEDYKKLLEALKGYFKDELSDEELKFTQDEAKPLFDAIKQKDMEGCLSELDILAGRKYSSYVMGNLEDVRAAIEIRDFEDAGALLEDVLLTIEISGL